jgi:hypothetical protein
MRMGGDQTTIWFDSEYSSLPIDGLVLLCNFLFSFYSLSKISCCLKWLERINFKQNSSGPSKSSNRIWQDSDSWYFKL